VRVLLVEDEAGLADAVAAALALDGFAVDVARNGIDGIHCALEHPYAAVVLDIMLPGLSGYDVVRRMRAAGMWTPVLMLTAKDGPYDIADALDLGADDYLVKPFALAELRARLRALVRRNTVNAELLSYGDLVLDLAAARVTRGGREVSLTRTEYGLLELFLRNPGRVLSHTQIFHAVWGYDFGLRSNNLWVYMSYLRGKLEAAGEPRILHTVRGLGYVLRDVP
jgi:two-component system response regulator MprA